MSDNALRNRLIAHHMALTAIPEGTANPLCAGIEFFARPANVKDAYAAGSAFVDEAIRLVKTAPDNPFASDDEIIAHLLAGIEAKKAQQMKGLGRT